MDRAEVLLALGHPGTAETPRLSDPAWHYFVNTGRDEKLTIAFDDDGRVQRVDGSPAALVRVLVPGQPAEGAPVPAARRAVMARDGEVFRPGP